MAFRAYLVGLTTRQAFGLFSLSLAIGATSIVFNFGVPWVPALAVLIYGSILLISLIKYQVQHSEATINSPYFLGFVLFLLSLFITFRSIALDSDAPQLDLITRQLGSALLTTIIGLPIRQALMALGRTQADQDLFFRTLEDELRQSATEFRKAQTELAQIIRELSESRRVLLTDERKAVSRYVASLRKATEFLDGTVGQYPAVLAAAMEGCSANLDLLKERLNNFSSSLAELDGVKIQKSFESCMGLPVAVTGVDAALTELRNSLAITSRSLAEVPKSLLTSLNSTAEPAMRSLQESVRAAASSFVEAPSGLATAAKEMAATLNDIPSSVRRQIALIEADIANINSILSQFVDILQTKAEAFN
jgi:methyl-accepting chemotaxis protein